MVRHQAALASGKLTRVTSGVNLPPSEVIMSRQCATHGGTTLGKPPRVGGIPHGGKECLDSVG